VFERGCRRKSCDTQFTTNEQGWKCEGKDDKPDTNRELYEVLEWQFEEQRDYSEDTEKQTGKGKFGTPGYVKEQQKANHQRRQARKGVAKAGGRKGTFYCGRVAEKRITVSWEVLRVVLGMCEAL
jgi:hypothetical protein